MSESGIMTPAEEALGVADQLEKDLLALLSTPLEASRGFTIEYLESAEFDDSSAETANEWALKAQAAHALLAETVAAIDASDVRVPSWLTVPSLFEMASDIIKEHIERGSPLKTFAELAEEREKRLASSDLPSFKLRSAFGGSDKETIDALKALKFQIPQSNQIISVSSSANPVVTSTAIPVVSVQVYRRLNNRETKVLEIEFSLSHTILEMFRFIVSLMPESRMWDGPHMSDSGLVIIGDDMFTAGSEDYSRPYSVWLDQFNIAHSVRRMEDVELGEISTLIDYCKLATCCFIQYCGSEMVRIYFSNIAMIRMSAGEEYPKITYKRRLPRPVRCVLCKTRAANLVIVNDVMLPANPSHCCNSCYRRIRSDGNGDFLMPPEDVIVSELCTI